MSDVSPSSEVLVSQLQRGDADALAELFSRYRERLKRLVEFRMDRRLRGRADASDVLQEVYLDASQRIRHFVKNPEVSFFVWLRQLATQRLVDTHRRHVQAKMRDVTHEVPIQRGDARDGTSASLALQLVGRWTSPSQLAVRAELLDRVQMALDGMDDIDREVLALRHYEELTNNEVAEVLGITKAAASNRYVRALTRLRQILEGVPGFFDESDAM